MKPLGLIAGEGVFPILVARGARAAGRKVICVGLHGCCWPELQAETDYYEEVGLLRLGKWIHVLREHGCDEAIMVGRVKKSQMYDRWRYFRYIPDWRTVKLWFGRLRHDKRPRAVMEALADELAQSGITLVDSTQYCQEQMCTLGVLTRRQPTPSQWIDVRFGWEICRTISRLDIGQAIAVINKDVIAVEALEGTNKMIERAGNLCRTGSWTMIKVANGPEDMRLDVPSVGTTTIENLHAAGAGCLVLEAGKTIMLERTKTLELADRYKIAIVGYDPAHPEVIPPEARGKESSAR
jgi:UDP-2,3-diacylglucosamine hydrolase